MVNSGPVRRHCPARRARTPSPTYLEKQGWGKRTVSYKLRDWLISRQRYWGAPIPMVYCDKCGIVPVPEKDLPVLLPEDAEFKPTGESPLKYNESFVNTTCPKCGGPAKRETDTMDTFMCSSLVLPALYQPALREGRLRPESGQVLDAGRSSTPAAPSTPSCTCFYARFFIKALRDMGLVDFGEPFTRLFNQGTIIAEHQKMSKSRGNVVNPDDYVGELGADTVRAYLMFVGPWEQGGEWDDSRHQRHLPLAEPRLEPGPSQRQSIGASAAGRSDADARAAPRSRTRPSRRVTEDMERLRFNTMLAALMEFTNYLTKGQGGRPGRCRPPGTRRSRRCC